MTLIINGKTYEADELIAYVQKIEKENKELRNRNAELKEMYTHSAKEAETYKQFLELKEKEQRELIDKVNDLEEKLANADYQLEGRDLEIKELKEQIEKMKCCYNCKHSRTEYEHCKTDKSEKWEIKEK